MWERENEKGRGIMRRLEAERKLERERDEKGRGRMRTADGQ